MGMELIWYKLLTVNQKRVGSSLSISTVLVAQSGRAEDCGSLWHGFKSHLTPQYTHIAQLVRAGILYIQG